MTHRIIAEHQVEEVCEAFFWAHRDHQHKIESATGDWSLVLHCKECSSWQTFEVDNALRHEALRAKLAGELERSGAVLF